MPLRDDRRPLLGKHRVAVGMIAMVMRVEHVTDRFLGGLANIGDDVARLFGEVGVVDQDIILEDDPDVVAAAEDHALVGGADRRVAEENARRDLPHLIELHLGDRLPREPGTDKTEQQSRQSGAHGGSPGPCFG
jgi:hypothetical protein